MGISDQHKVVISSYAGVIILASIIFVAAGTILYLQAILYLGLAIFGTTLTHFLTPDGSAIAARRVRTAGSGEPWDKAIMGILFMLSLVTFIVAGLDSGRFGWTQPLPVSVPLMGAVMMFAGQVLFAFARRENAFFTSTVQIASDRSHTVCSTGPYRIVRHPGYAGMVLTLIAFPLVLTALWAMIPAVLSVVVLVIRVQKEDAFLLEHLPGYRDYSARVASKLIPYVF